MSDEAAPDAERDAVLAALRPVVDGIAATFGPVCEVVLHDYRRPERSVVAVAGSVTGRTAGGTGSGTADESGIRVPPRGGTERSDTDRADTDRAHTARRDTARDALNHVTRTDDGTLLKSSTMVLRDSTGTVFGALCVHLDVTAVDRAHALLGALAGTAGLPADPPATTFGDDIDAVVDAIVDTHPLRRAAGWAALDRDQRLELFRDLDGRGVFAVRRSVEHVANRLGISRASAYHYLSRARAATGPAADTP
ncbi:helix-turn-helix transcriptional regulator [Streptomyces sp. enrichment culture]|uniref:helix-turn-helix transcriptional regulator n=1 Tax=Streptomyces sp. enrichment culture TaxID=1795815 RepID=UPI003F54F037